MASFAAGASKRNLNGRQKAQLFRQVRVPRERRDQRRCDLEQILEEDGLEVCESELEDCGYTACLIRAPEHGGGIMVARSQDAGRRRFSLAHELGHFHIPTHREVGLVISCADGDLRAREKDAHQLEWEANDFATELLMPRRLFAADVATRETSFRTAEILAGADMYDVSLTAAAWRVVQTTRQPCALVVSKHGEIEWTALSDSWRFPAPEQRRALPIGSMADAVVRGEAPNVAPEPISPEIWLASTIGDTPNLNGIELLESTHAVPRIGQVLSMLWIVEEEPWA